jgi:acetyltransferase
MQELPDHEIAISQGERLLVRPVRREDEAAIVEMMAMASPEDVRFRCFGAIKDFPHMMAARLVKIDPARETTLVAESIAERGRIMGIVHMIDERTEPSVAEYDIMVRPDHKGHGLGYRLMQEILSEAGRKGLKAVEGYILCDNDAMLRMAEELGFKKVSRTGDVVRMRHEVQARPVSEN